MLWKGRRQSDNIQDVRGSGGGLGGGRSPMRLPIGRGATGGGISGIVILVVLFFVLRCLRHRCDGTSERRLRHAGAGRRQRDHRERHARQ